MIREDRELLTELARVNRNLAPRAMRIMEGSASTAEQQHYGQRLIAAGQQLCRRADENDLFVVAGDVVVAEPLTLPGDAVESQRNL